MSAGGPNVTSRHETIEIDNRRPTYNQHIETINSKDRDFKTYPNPNTYTIRLSRDYKRVMELELLSAEIPKTHYVIEERDSKIGSTGNNQFRFGEGYIIDDGSIFGTCNDRLQIREYSPPGTCDPHCQVHEVLLPRTLTRLKSVELLATERDPGREHDETCSTITRILVTTHDSHRLSRHMTPVVYIVDHCRRGVGLDLNGRYHVKSIVNEFQYIAERRELCQPCEPLPRDETEVSDASAGAPVNHFRGWMYLPRVPSPDALAALVQDYTNTRASPPLCNSYSVCFNSCKGRFYITRAYGLTHFDLLGGSDCASILKTMGFTPVDYLYGQWARQNHQQTQLPGDALFDPMLRPDVGSETVGESALVALKAGNYDPSTLSKAITDRMHLPLVIVGKNDTLAFQVRGQVHLLVVPPGMYTPDLLIQAIARMMEADGKAKYRGYYDVCDGIYSLENQCAREFGLLFSRSTIGGLLGFRKVDLTGSPYYESMSPSFYPMMNGRYTNQLYRVEPEFTISKFRFSKLGAYQAQVVAVEASPDGEKRLRLWTHTSTRRGTAHGLQAGDVIQLNGPCEGEHGAMQTQPAWNGWHVVDKVLDAYSCELALHYVAGDPADGSNVMTQAYEPFFLQFPGVKDNIAEVVGFQHARGGCVEYVGNSQWEFLSPCEIFINLKQACQGDWGRITKVSDSSAQCKYTWKVMTSFARIPRRCQFGATPITGFIRKEKFLFNTVDFAELCIEFTDQKGNPVNFHGKEHCLSFRFFTET